MLNSRPKIALCLSGQARFVRQNFPNIKRSILDLEDFDVDIFIHTWNSVDSVNDAGKSNNNLLQRLSIYNPKKVEIEDQVIFPEDLFSATADYTQYEEERRRWLFQRTYSMFYSIYRANQLKRAEEERLGEKYTCVIRARTDNILPEIFNPWAFIFSSSLKLYIHSYPFNPPDMPSCYSDQLAYGDSQVMDIYSDLYSNIGSCIKNTKRLHQGTLLTWYLDKFTSIPCISDGFLDSAQDKLMRGLDEDSGVYI